MWKVKQLEGVWKHSHCTGSQLDKLCLLGIDWYQYWHYPLFQLVGICLCNISVSYFYANTWNKLVGESIASYQVMPKSITEEEMTEPKWYHSVLIKTPSSQMQYDLNKYTLLSYVLFHAAAAKLD